MSQKLTFTNSVAEAIDAWAESARPRNIFIIADSNTRELVVRQLEARSRAVAAGRVITVAAGEKHKNLESLASIWLDMSTHGGTRSSAVVNIGGGVVTDMGGFAAATFKRGVRFINVPTTILAAVDAAVGGKTGIDFHGYKNEIGAFAPAEEVIISSRFFSTLPREELLSGYAEMVKHSLLSSGEALGRLIAGNPLTLEPDKMLELVRESVLVKENIVRQDPREQGLRKALNLGHTAGHALESLALESGAPVPHGFAVAWGLVTALVMSHMRHGFSSGILHEVSDFVKTTYPAPAFTCDDYPAIIELMRHDKKNKGDGTISFTLLRAPGEIDTDATATPQEITAALDIMRDLLGV